MTDRKSLTDRDFLAMVSWVDARRDTGLEFMKALTFAQATEKISNLTGVRLSQANLRRVFKALDLQPGDYTRGGGGDTTHKLREQIAELRNNYLALAEAMDRVQPDWRETLGTNRRVPWTQEEDSDAID